MVLLLLSVVAGLITGIGRFDGLPRSDAGGSVYARVYGTTSDLRGLLGAGFRTVADYGSFRLVETSRSNLESLQARGIRAAEEPYVFSQAINGYVFDVRDGDRVVPAALRAAPQGGTEYVVVHFAGPIKTEWTAAVAAAGGTVLDYVPFFSYIVRADAEARAAVSALPFVIWVGEYHPAYKIHPALVAAQGPVAVRVVTFSREAADPVLSLLSRRGDGFVGPASESTGILRVSRLADHAVLQARVDASEIPAMAGLPGVEYIEPLRPVRPWNANMQWIVQTNVSSPSPSRRVWDMGIHGEGQVIAIADTGVDYDHAMFRESAGVIQKGDIYNVTDATRRKIVRYWPVGILTTGDTTWPDQGGDTWAIRDSPDSSNGVTDCESGHGTQVDGTAAGNDDGLGTSANDGSAKGAKVFFQDIGTVRRDPMCGVAGGRNDILDYLPNDLGDLFSIPYGDPIAPARIHSNSWGSPGAEYDLQARQVDAFMWTHPDSLVIFSAGNDGPTPRSVGMPGTNKNGLAVGATDSPSDLGSQNTLFSFSSHGPTLDGRLKPDVTTPGVGVSSDSDGNPYTSANLHAEHLWGGTSYAAPAAAGAAAMVRQYFVDGWYPTGARVPQNGFAPSAALVKAILTSSGAQMTCEVVCGADLNTYPNNAQGWGRILLDNSLHFSGDARALWLRDDPHGLFTGESLSFPVRVASGAVPLRIVLVWTDYPGLANANPALVNDLDLTVTDPFGNTYLGNVYGTYAAGESKLGGASDRLNPIEGVIRKTPAAGVWTVTVSGASVAFGPQPFALVAVGGVDTGFGSVALDRTTYGGNDRIAISVLDSNATSVTVNVASGSEPAGEAIALAATAPGSGMWRGTVVTDLGAPRTDGVLQVSDRDAITVTYSDSSPAHTAVVQARVDARSPKIASVHAADITDSGATVTWTTDEPSTSWVYYGIGALDHLARSPELSQAHATPLEDLRTDTEYLYDVVSTDPNGQRTIDDNGGRHHRFRTAGQADVLLVIGDSTFPDERAASYGRAFAAQGWPVAEWHVDVHGDPSLATLRRYKAVVWNPGLEQYPMMTPAGRALLRAYVDGGGRLLFSSHDTAWDLCSGDAKAHTTTDSCAWVKGTLHASWQVDPPGIAALVGYAGNPISGGYTGGTAYTQHRTGGAGDEIDPVAAGGSTTPVWRDSGARPDDVAVLWESASPNGTPTSGCVWCGTRSRVASYFFEFTGIDFATTASAVRADILDRTLIWLLGRDHPDVTVGAPNGGETITGDTTRISWTRAAQGANVSRQVLRFSTDGGQTWTPIASVPGTASDYIWTLGGLPNRAQYRVRVDVLDDGSPPFAGSDTSDANFAIARPGGDDEGPAIVPGSLTVDPNPPRDGRPVRFNATANDTRSGNSAIAAAEWFVQDAKPEAAQSGRGNTMTAVAPPFDGPVEDITDPTLASWFVGPQCVWVHAQDTAGNWGPFAFLCFSVVPAAGDVVPPARSTLIAATLSGAGNADVALNWSRAADDTATPTPGGTTAYRVMRSTSVDGPYVQIGSRTANGSATYAFVDAGAGESAAPWYVYRIRSLDAAGNTVDSEGVAARVTIPLRPGLNTLSLPVVPTDPGIASVFRGVGLGGVWAFDACSGLWRSYAPGRPGNDLTTISLGMGLFVNATAMGRLTVAGLLPTSTWIPLCAGWNLVGFPSVSSSIIAADARLDLGATRILAGDPAAPPGLMAVADGGRLFVPTQAFWLFLPSPKTWTVPGR